MSANTHSDFNKRQNLETTSTGPIETLFGPSVSVVRCLASVGQTNMASRNLIDAEAGQLVDRFMELSVLLESSVAYTTLLLFLSMDMVRANGTNTNNDVLQQATRQVGNACASLCLCIVTDRQASAISSHEGKDSLLQNFFRIFAKR